MDIAGIEWVKKIHDRLRDSGFKLSIAESCTGGLISHLMTSLPGASSFLDSSIVSYSNDSKIGLLGVSASLIREHGAVSEEVAREMARAIRKKRKTDISLSTTGNLGPDAIEKKPVGLVYMAVDWERNTTSKGMMFEGTREEIKYQAALSSIHFLYEVVETWI